MLGCRDFHPDRLKGSARCNGLSLRRSERSMAAEAVMHKRRTGATRAMMIVGLFLLIWSSGPSAQDRRLLDSNGYVRDAAYARPLVPAAEQKYLKIDGVNMQETLKEATATALRS